VLRQKEGPGPAKNQGKERKLSLIYLRDSFGREIFSKRVNWAPTDSKKNMFDPIEGPLCRTPNNGARLGPTVVILAWPAKH